MSRADGVYILYTDTDTGGEYRVKYCGNGINNIYGTYDNLTENWTGDDQAILETFNDAELFENRALAWARAQEMDEDHGFTEFGVLEINSFRDRGNLFYYGTRENPYE